MPKAVSPPPLSLPPKMEKMVIPSAPPLIPNGLHSMMPSPGPPLLASPPLPPQSAAEMMAMASLQSSLVALASSPMTMMPMPPQPIMAAADSHAVSALNGSGGGAYVCMHCGKAFKEHAEFLAHDSICALNSRAGGSELSPMACDR